MAKIGTTTARWTKTTEPDHDGRSVRRDYGLRDDGILLRKVTYLNADGSVDFSGRWTVVARDPRIVTGMTNDLYNRLGFEKVQ